MSQSIFDTQINILLEEGKGLKCGLTKKQLTDFFKGKEDLILKNGIVLSSYGTGEKNDDEQSRAIISLAEKHLDDEERFIFDNSIGGRTCIIIGKGASELAKLAVCDVDNDSKADCENGLAEVPCKFPRGRKLKHFGNKRIKDEVKKAS